MDNAIRLNNMTITKFLIEEHHVEVTKRMFEKVRGDEIIAYLLSEGAFISHRLLYLANITTLEAFLNAYPETRQVLKTLDSVISPRLRYDFETTSKPKLERMQMLLDYLLDVDEDELDRFLVKYLL